MLQQFRRAIGLTITGGNMEHKMARLHYVRATVEEARATCNVHNINNRWRQGGRSNWYTQHAPAEYSTSEQFRNGYVFNMHYTTTSTHLKTKRETTTNNTIKINTIITITLNFQPCLRVLPIRHSLQQTHNLS